MKTNSVNRPAGPIGVTLSALLAGGLLLASAQAQVPASASGNAGDVPGLAAPMTDSSSGAIINAVPPTRRITDPVPVSPVLPAVSSAPAPVVPPPAVNPAAGVVPNAPGATGPVLRPEIGRSNLDRLQSTPPPNMLGNPGTHAPCALSPAEAAQRQLMIERENRMHGLDKQP